MWLWGKKAQKYDPQAPDPDHHHPLGVPPHLLIRAATLPSCSQRQESGASTPELCSCLLIHGTDPERGHHRTKPIKELDGLGNLGQVTLPPRGSTSLLTPQKFSKAGIFFIVCAAPTPTGCALLLVIAVSTAISFKGPGISISVESKERAWLVGGISRGLCSLDGCPLARICLAGTFPKQLQGDEN